MIQAILTIDDVPSNNTPAIADYLCKRGIQAVMFAWGARVAVQPDEAVYALKRGMILGNHSYTHPQFSALTFEQAASEIDRCERTLDEVYRLAGRERHFRPFRFPYGDKGGENRARLQAYLREAGFDKLDDSMIRYPFWHERGLDRDIDTLWTFDFAEYQIRQSSGFGCDDVYRRIYDRHPADGAPMLAPDGRHIILLHAHDETEAIVPGYCARFIDELLGQGVTFLKPTFVKGTVAPRI